MQTRLVDCSACHGKTETDAQPGDIVKCGICGAQFRAPMPRAAAAPPSSDAEAMALFFGPMFAASAEQLEGVLIEVLGGPDAFDLVKQRAIEKFGEFIAELETDPGFDLEVLGSAFTAAANAMPPAAPPAADGDAAAASVEIVEQQGFLDAIRLVVREEMAEALDDFNDDFATDLATLLGTEHVDIRLMASPTDGALIVSILVAGRWVPVIEDVFSASESVVHIVEPAEIEARVKNAIESGAGDDADLDAGAGGTESDDDGDLDADPAPTG